MKRYTRRVCLAGAMAAGVMLMGCSEDDNLDQWQYTSFPGIVSQETAQKRQSNAELSGDGLAYQAALIHEIVLNHRAYDGIERPLTDEPNGRSDCELDGFIYHLRDTQTIPTAFGTGPVEMSQVVAYGCVVAEGDEGETERKTIGELNFANDDVPCDEGEGQCEIAYNTYDYAIQYLTPAGAGTRDWRRAQIDGYTVDGPRPPVEVDGVSREVSEFRQNMVLASSIATLTAANEVESEKVFSLQFGSGSAPFVQQQIAGVDQLSLDGVLSSGAMGESCTGGRFEVETVTRLMRDGDNLVAGELTLTSGSGETAQEATLSFLPNGDVEASAGEETVTLARADLEALRDTCFQTVVAKR